MAQNNHVERWDSDVFQSKEQSKIISDDLKKNLKYMPHPFHGWRSVPNQDLKTIQINEYGLRCKRFEQTNKKKRNCILLGGSVAWGFGASSNQNIPSFLIEKYLNQNHDINLNVINFAEQMHSSHEELLTFINILNELNPEVVICLSVTNDINRAFIDIYKTHHIHIKQLNFFLKGQKLGLIEEEDFLSFLLKSFFRYHKKSNTINYNNFEFHKYERNKIALNLLKEKMDVINLLSFKKGIKVFHFIQPDLIFKKFPSSFELEYLNWIPLERKEFVKKSFLEAKEFIENQKEEKNIFYQSLLNIFDSNKEDIFFDKAHMSDYGYKLISKEIAKKIARHF